MKKVLITSHSFGRISKKPFEILKMAGLSWKIIDPDRKPGLFEKIVADYDALIVGLNHFAPQDMERCKKLQIISKNGVGLDNIDLRKAHELGITVTNVPGVNSEAVADLTFAHILNLSRGISLSNRWLREGHWEKYVGNDVFQKTLGLIGFGGIARKVACRARGFSMRVLTCDPFLEQIPQEFQDTVSLCSFKTVLQNSDIVSIHIPLTEKNRNLFSKNVMLTMKKGAILVNTARGGIINEQDLLECIQSGHLRGAALDVLESEPPRPDHPFFSMDQIVVTPHMGMSTEETIDRVGVICAQCVADKLSGRVPNHIAV